MDSDLIFIKKIFGFIYISMNGHFRHKWVILNTRMTFRWMSEQYFVAYSVFKIIYVSTLIYLILVQKIL